MLNTKCHQILFFPLYMYNYAENYSFEYSIYHMKGTQFSTLLRNSFFSLSSDKKRCQQFTKQSFQNSDHEHLQLRRQGINNL